MHECLRVEKLPCIFLGKRESLFIILFAGSKRVGLCSERYQISCFGRWGLNKVNFCGAAQKSPCFHQSEKRAPQIPLRCLRSRVMAQGGRSLWQDGAGKAGPRMIDAKLRQDAKQPNRRVSCTWMQREWKCKSSLFSPVQYLLDKTY